MSDPLGARTINLLLASLVLAWAIVPPTVRHGHEGGEDSGHRHDSVGQHVHDRDSRGHSEDGGLPPAGVESPPSIRGELVVHLHWCVLGLDFSLPLSERAPSWDERYVARPAIVSLGDGLPAPARDNHGASLTLAAMLPTGLDSPVAPASATAAVDDCPSATLCDRARHERSGVLVV